ncbi:MAG: DUF1559 domain-containing protein [Pirellulales bacterium]
MVELLVVIAIIAMLVGLLIPAVMRAREAGRRTTCLNNQQNIGKAILNYVTSKEKFPPLFSLQPDPNSYNPSPQAVGWVPPMLPYLEQNPLYQAFQANRWKGDLSVPNDGLQNAEVEILICPSRNPTNTPAPLSYVVNAGVQDWYSDTLPLDYKENGLFFDDYAWRPQVLNASYLKPPVTDITYVSKHDGTKMTMMVTENLDALDWIAVETTPLPGPSSPAPKQPTYLPMNRNVKTWWQAFTWIVYQPANTPNWGLKGFAFGTSHFNQPVQGNESDLYWGRPSSAHSGGVIATMAGGHSQFLSDEIDWRVYCLLLSPDSQNVKDSRYPAPYGPSPPAVQFKYPANWYTLQPVPNTPPLPLLKPLTEVDVNP